MKTHTWRFYCFVKLTSNPYVCPAYPCLHMMRLTEKIMKEFIAGCDQQDNPWWREEITWIPNGENRVKGAKSKRPTLKKSKQCPSGDHICVSM